MFVADNNMKQHGKSDKELLLYSLKSNRVSGTFTDFDDKRTEVYKDNVYFGKHRSGILIC